MTQTTTPSGQDADWDIVREFIVYGSLQSDALAALDRLRNGAHLSTTAREIAAQLIPHTTSVHNVGIIQGLLDRVDDGMLLPELPDSWMICSLSQSSGDWQCKLFNYEGWFEYSKICTGKNPRAAVLAAIAAIASLDDKGE